MGAAVLVPVKAFSRAKLRLAPALDGPARADLARRMAGHVVAAAAPLPVSVVCDDAEVAAWAAEHGAAVVWTPGLRLNGAVGRGVTYLHGLGYSRVIVAHADLPLARSLDDLAVGEGVALVPDRHDDGTNVAVVPAHAPFRFAYGPGSFDRHRREGERLGLAVHVRRMPELAWDVDVPADLLLPSVPGVLPCS